MREKIKKLILDKKIVFLLFATVVLLLYVKAINGPFIYDDNSLVIFNDNLKSLGKIGDYFTTHLGAAAPADGYLVYRPMHTLAHAIIYNIFGATPPAFHLFSILLHIVNGYLVFLLLTKLKFSQTGSFIGGLFFLLHPVQIQAVSYISSVTDVMVATFIMSGLLVYTNIITSTTFRRKWFKMVGMLFLFILAFLTKESAVIFFPLLCILTYFLKDSINKKSRKITIIAISASLFLVLLYLFLRFYVFTFVANTLNPVENPFTNSLLVRISTFISILWDYAVLIIMPIKLHMIKISNYYVHILTFRGIFGLSVLLASILVAVYSIVKKTKVWFGILWFFVCLIPFMGIIPANAKYMEHWLYLPIVGIVVLVVTFFDKLVSIGWRKISIVIFLIIFSLYGYRVIIRNAEWNNPTAFFLNEIKHNPYTPRARVLLGYEYIKKGQYIAARDVLAEGVSMTLHYPPQHHFLALAYLGTGEKEKAIAELKKALSREEFIYAQKLLSKLENNEETPLKNYLPPIEK